MTNLDKPVVRRTNTLRNGRKLIVTLRPDDQISFRLEGTSQTCTAPVSDIFRFVQRTDTTVCIPQRKS